MLDSAASKLLPTLFAFTLAFHCTSQCSARAQLAERPVPSQHGTQDARPQSPDEDEALRLLKQSLDLAKRGQLDAALSAGESSLEVCEKKVQHDPLCAAAAQTSLALLYLRKRDLGRAETLYLRALEIFERQLGPGKFDVVGSLINLAKSFAESGDRPRAIGMYLRALEALEKRYGPEHAEIASLLQSLGHLYRETGAFSQSEQAFKRALAIRQKVLGGAHPEVAWTLNSLGGLYRVTGDYDRAERAYTEAVAILEKEFGPENSEVATVIDNLGLVYQEKKDYDRAKKMHERAVVIFERTLGPDHIDVAIALGNLAGLHDNKGNYPEAERMARRALAIKEQKLPPDDPDLAVTLDNLANVIQLQGGEAEAEQLRLRALSIFEKAYGPVHIDVAIALNNLASIPLRRGEYDRAEALFRRALTINEQLFGAEHLSVAESLDKLAELYERKGDFAQAEQLFTRALGIKQRALGPTHPDVILSLDNLALFYVERGDRARVESIYKQVLAIREKVLSPDHPSITTTLGDLARLYESAGDYAQAEAMHKRALAIREKAFGPEHPEVAQSLNNLALTYNAKGDYRRAVPLFERALAINEKLLGPRHRITVTALLNLAGAYTRTGNYAAAEPLFKRALETTESIAGTDSDFMARPLAQFAFLNHDKGDYASGATLLERALKIKEKTLGPNHPELALYINNLAALYQAKGDYQRRNEMYERWLKIYKEGGLKDENVAVTLANAANVMGLTGEPETAERLIKMALRLTEKARGPEHPELATLYTNLGELYRRTGRYAEAEQFLGRALAIREKWLGTTHPGVARCLSDLAALSEAMGDIKAAIALDSRSTEIFEHNLSAVLYTGSEAQKQSYMALLNGQTHAVVSLHVRHAPNDPQALRLALTTVLRRKGRVLSAMSDQIAALRSRLDPRDAATLDRLSRVRSRLAALQFDRPANSPTAERQVAIAKLDEEARQLEADISTRSAEFRELSQPVSIEDLRKLIPPDAVLVELVLYEAFDPKAKAHQRSFGAEHYVAYVLRREGEPSFAHLGEAAPIDRAVARLRVALADPKSSDVERAARALDELVMRPVRRQLRGAGTVLLSPDGALNLVPFGALVDEQGKYLVENYAFIYLTSGRDLLRLGTRAESRNAPLVMADPLYDFKASARQPTLGGQNEGMASRLDANRRSIDFTSKVYASLPGTAEEAAALNKLWPEARVLTQEAATEAALKHARGPRLLHIATHGFFLSDQPQHPPTSNTPRRETFDSLDTADLPAGWENLLLRSGLVLAGVKQQASGPGEDGVLTALEVTGLDLWGTKLAVLSACETGIGDVKGGEGVYGLRRALVLAGSETQVMSLWKVSDAGTRDLMVAYYTRLQKGEGRAEALRQVQLQMLRGQMSPVTGGGRREMVDTGGKIAAKDYRHPYYWAAFIQSGDWRSMDGK